MGAPVPLPVMAKQALPGTGTGSGMLLSNATEASAQPELFNQA